MGSGWWPPRRRACPWWPPAAVPRPPRRRSPSAVRRARSRSAAPLRKRPGIPAACSGGAARMHHARPVADDQQQRGPRRPGNPARQRGHELLDDVGGRLAEPHRVLGLVDHDLGRRPRHLEQDVFLVGEVEVERALADPGGAGDLLRRGGLERLLEPALVPDLQRGADQLAPGVARALLRERGAARRSTIRACQLLTRATCAVPHRRADARPSVVLSLT